MEFLDNLWRVHEESPWRVHGAHGVHGIYGFHGSLLSEDLPLIHNRLEVGCDAIVLSEALPSVDQGLAHIQLSFNLSLLAPSLALSCAFPPDKEPSMG